MNSSFKPPIDDLFSESNPFYLEASAFPKTRPISFIDLYIDPDLKENRKRERFPNSSYNNASNFSYNHNNSHSNYNSKSNKQFNYELESLTIDNCEEFDPESDDNIFFSFGKKYVLAENLNVFRIKEQIKKQFEDIVIKNMDKFGVEELKLRKKKHLSDIEQGQFSDKKAIKMADLIHSKDDEGILQVTNFIDLDTFNVVLSASSAGYFEYLLHYCNSCIDSYKVWMLANPTTKTKIYESKFLDKFIANYEVLDHQDLTQAHIIRIKKNILAQNESGVNCIINIKSERSEKYQSLEEKELKSLGNVLSNISLCTQIMKKEENTFFIIKLYTKFHPKTYENMFLIYSLFENIEIKKPITSSYLSHENYLICKNYRHTVGNFLKDKLLENIDVWREDKSYGLIPTRTITSDTNFYSNLIELVNTKFIHKFIEFYEYHLSNSNSEENSLIIKINEKLVKWKISVDINKLQEKKNKKLEQEKQATIINKKIDYKEALNIDVDALLGFGKKKKETPVVGKKKNLHDKTIPKPLPKKNIKN